MLFVEHIFPMATMLDMLHSPCKSYSNLLSTNSMWCTSNSTQTFTLRCFIWCLFVSHNIPFYHNASGAVTMVINVMLLASSVTKSVQQKYLFVLNMVYGLHDNKHTHAHTHAHTHTHTHTISKGSLKYARLTIRCVIRRR